MVWWDWNAEFFDEEVKVTLLPAFGERLDIEDKYKREADVQDGSWVSGISEGGEWYSSLRPETQDKRGRKTMHSVFDYEGLECSGIARWRSLVAM